MRLSCTIFEILSLTFQKFKRLHDSGHALFRDSLSSVGWDLLCTTHVPNLKCLQLPAMKIWKAKHSKNSRFQPHFGGLRCTAQSSSMAQWKAHCRLPITDNWTFFASYHGWDTIKRNLSQSAFTERMGCSFIRSLLQAKVQPTLDPSAETFISVQCASPGRGGNW